MNEKGSFASADTVADIFDGITVMIYGFDDVIEPILSLLNGKNGRWK